MVDLTIKKNVSVKPYNTFGVEASCDYFATIDNPQDVYSLFRIPEFRDMPKLILGQGSNILFTKNFSGLIIKNNIKGITTLRETDDQIWIEVGAGENWHQFVMYCIEHNYAGVENLSLIPGTAGAAPIQNIGAYGVELKDIFYQLNAIHLQNGMLRTFSKDECEFGYRNSIFKNKFKHQFMITSVVLQLSKKPSFNTKYTSLKAALNGINSEDLSLKKISDAVITIRREKLPDPNTLGNAGSFFKNPVITHEHFKKLSQQYSSLPHFLQKDQSVKINAGWLIEQCGFKGKRYGDAGVYAKQALVLVNYGRAAGLDVLSLAKEIQTTVASQFDIVLEPEVVLL